tara:strand:- start:224 stop:400 length:177 start_codon:yes stop_codon:yes gene_type:complete
MTDLTLVLMAITLILWGFVSGMGYVIIRNLSNKLAYYERREAEIQSIVDRRMNGEDNE